MTKTKVCSCGSKWAQCPKCNQMYRHGTKARCNCYEGTVPLRCIGCAMVVAEDLSGTLTYKMELIPWRCNCGLKFHEPLTCEEVKGLKQAEHLREQAREMAPLVDQALNDRDFIRHYENPDFYEDYLWLCYNIAPARAGALNQVHAMAEVFLEEVDEDHWEDFEYGIQELEVELAILITNAMKRELPTNVIVMVGRWPEGCYGVMLVREVT